MILAKLRGTISSEEAERLKRELEKKFPGEEVIVINAEKIELEFINFGAVRCKYCGILQKDTSATACTSCGAAY